MPQLNSLIILLMSLAASASLFGVCKYGARQFAPKESYQLNVGLITAKHQDTILYNTEAPPDSSDPSRWDAFKAEYEKTQKSDKPENWPDWSEEKIRAIKDRLATDLPLCKVATERRDALEKLDLNKEYSLKKIGRDVLNLRPDDKTITLSIDGKELEFCWVTDKGFWLSTEEFPEEKWPLPEGPPKSAVKNKAPDIVLAFKEPTVTQWLLAHAAKDKPAIKNLDDGLGEYVFDKDDSRLVIGMSNWNEDTKKGEKWLTPSAPDNRKVKTAEEFNKDKWLASHRKQADDLANAKRSQQGILNTDRTSQAAKACAIEANNEVLAEGLKECEQVSAAPEVWKKKSPRETFAYRLIISEMKVDGEIIYQLQPAPP